MGQLQTFASLSLERRLFEHLLACPPFAPTITIHFLLRSRRRKRGNWKGGELLYGRWAVVKRTQNPFFWSRRFHAYFHRREMDTSISTVALSHNLGRWRDNGEKRTTFFWERDQKVQWTFEPMGGEKDGLSRLFGVSLGRPLTLLWRSFSPSLSLSLSFVLTSNWKELRPKWAIIIYCCCLRIFCLTFASLAAHWSLPNALHSRSTLENVYSAEIEEKEEKGWKNTRSK